MNVPTLPAFATFAKVTGTVTTSPASPVAAPIVTSRPSTGFVSLIAMLIEGLLAVPKSNVNVFVVFVVKVAR